MARDDAAVPTRRRVAVPGDPPPAHHERAVREGPERDRDVRRRQQHHADKEQTDIAYFWNGNNVNQFNVTMQNVVAQHDMDIDDAAHLFGDGR